MRDLQSAEAPAFGRRFSRISASCRNITFLFENEACNLLHHCFDAAQRYTFALHHTAKHRHCRIACKNSGRSGEINRQSHCAISLYRCWHRGRSGGWNYGARQNSRESSWRRVASRFGSILRAPGQIAAKAEQRQERSLLWTCGIIRQTRQRLQQIPAVESQ